MMKFFSRKQLAEFDLHCRGKDYETAARVLLENDYDHLLLWGQYKTVIDMHRRMQGKLNDPDMRRKSSGNLGSAYYSIGKYPEAIKYYEKALLIAREIGDRRGEGNHINNLGVAFGDKKKYMEALACYLLAEDIRIEIKDPNIKTTESNLNNLKEKLGEKEFEKLRDEVRPKAHKILMNILDCKKSGRKNA